MSTEVRDMQGMPASQQAIIDRCLHPSGTFIPFEREAIEQSISDRFEQTVRRHPHRLAVRAGDEELTYAELNRASNRIAHAVLELRGEGSEPIALLFDHDAPVIEAIMGVLKAGKFYVPLDPMHPESRSADILGISGAGLILTNDKNLPLAGGLTQDSRHLLNIDNLDSNLSSENFQLDIPSDTTCFVLFTSGSTGVPKGVVQTHRNVLHDIMNYTNVLHVSPKDRFSLLRPLNFVGATRQLYGALLNGAAAFPFDLRVEGFEYMADWFRRREISIYRGVPTILRRLTASLTGSEQFPSVRVVYLGGEVSDVSDVALYKRHFGPECILAIGMGSTETLTSRWYFIDKETRIGDGPVPVGYAVEGKEILVVDDDGQEVGSNEVGELVVKSQFLSPGYWQDSDLTSRSFSPDPTGEGNRMYYTGDLASIGADGCLTFRGRKDFRVNIKGHSIEVAEVERVLRGNSSVREAVVVAREDRPEDIRLVAYVVPAKQAVPTVSRLRHDVARSLPDYMVPSSFVIVDALPLNASGKVDRKALPAPGNGRPDLDSKFVAARTPVEKVLAGLWAEALDLDEVGIDDGFFDLGGHSLLASQILSRAISTFQVELPLKALLESPTVAEMAIVITEHQANKVGRVEIDQMLAELEALSDQHARSLLAGDEPLSQRKGKKA